MKPYLVLHLDMTEREPRWKCGVSDNVEGLPSGQYSKYNEAETAVSQCIRSHSHLILRVTEAFDSPGITAIEVEAAV